MTVGPVPIAIGMAILVWFAWRLLSRRTLLPCPSLISCLVEMENPLARITRSENVVRELGVHPANRVADIGCGPGRVTIALAHAVGPEGTVVAIDIQPGMLEKVSRKAAAEQLSNIQLLQCDAREKALPDGSLDGAVMVMALGEMPEPERVFSMAYSALRSGGRLLVSESMFDPHFVRRKRVFAMAIAAGFAEKSIAGNRVAYTAVFERPLSKSSLPNTN